ncbi:hypothetical protein P3T37_007196 [Kitasatospora sp. MAA4]|uniref:hypothetical protein n=1 Tax=Kitasatospora sp. MAA4 TaxID=3035093 RepID=UPI0024743CCF|nr:hypothetical protein [Kitasatospora sp. MAA4]MDH6137763.1 hypothetical protein [Kitasatospora sp. MAA4]
MTIAGEDQGSARGQVLLLAAAPRGSRRRLLDPEYAVGAVAAVPVQTLLPGWRGPVDVVPLLDPTEPQAVLARIREAAATAGPLLLYVVGLLYRDHRQRLLHVALAATDDSTVRYSALPWPWLARELAGRQPGSTAVVLDLVVDPSCLPMRDDDLLLPAQVARWGAVAPPVGRGPRQVPGYTRALTELLRTAPAGRVHLPELHAMAAGQAGLAPGTVLLSSPSPGRVEIPMPRPHPGRQAPSAPPAAPHVPATAAEPVADLRPAIAQAMRAGHHHAAAELAAQWERAVLRSAGRESALMGDVLEVQATAAAASGATVRAAERWIATAEHRLRWGSPGDQAVRLAVRNGLHCWRQLDDDEPLLPELGGRLAAALRAIDREQSATGVEERMSGARTLPAGEAGHEAILKGS